VAFLLQTMNWSYALGRFLGETTDISCGIHMCLEGIYFGVIKVHDLDLIAFDYHT
jgi:hypothetical protein